jgi:hypothetical protein
MITHTEFSLNMTELFEYLFIMFSKITSEPAFVWSATLTGVDTSRVMTTFQYTREGRKFDTASLTTRTDG